MENPHTSEFVEIDGLETHYVTAGTGHPVILIHGGSPGACSLVNWKLNIGPLADAGFAVCAVDQPGFGLTDNPSDHSMEYRVAHALSFIETQGFDRFHVVGNSVGAYIAARMALHDRRVARLVLVSSSTLAPAGSAEARARAAQHGESLRSYTPSLENMRAMTERTHYDRSLVTEDLVRDRYEMSTGRHFEATVRRREVPRAEPLTDQLAGLDVKTLILWGANDRGAALERAVLLFEALPDAELHVFDRCGHWVQWDHAARFNNLVAGFLAAA